MYTVIDKNNSRITEFTGGEGVSFLGEDEYLTGIKRAEVSSEILIVDVEGELKYILTPACFEVELYYIEEEGKLVLSDDFFLLAERLSDKEIDADSISFFVSKSYAPGGDTFLKRIKRLKSASKYSLKSSILHVEEKHYALLNGKLDYEYFLRSLEKVCIEKSKGKKVGILFSGGADSLSIALVLEKLNVPFVLYTGEMFPRIRENQEDVLKAKTIASDRGWEHKVVSIDYNQSDFNDLSSMIDLMPFSSHLSLIFIRLMKEMKEDMVDVCFSGQNLDNLYNLGATAGVKWERAGLIDLARRFLTSELYFSSYENYGVKSIATKAIAWLSLLFYCIMRKSFNYRLPKNLHELYVGFLSSPDNTIFVHKDYVVPKSNGMVEINAGNLRSLLVKSRVTSYLSSGDSLAIVNAAKICGIKAVLPFSEELLIPYFIGRKSGVSDIFRPKEHVHTIVSNLYDTHNKIKVNKVEGCLGYHQWAESVFPNTKFAKSLPKENIGVEEYATPALRLSALFSKAWLGYVINKVN